MGPSDSGTREFAAEQSASGAPEGDGPTRQFLAAPVSDRCASCGTPLAPDQHYCINCGERRGKPRFPVGAPATQEVAYERVAAAPPLPPRERFSSSSVFVTGVGVLLLAMGVGVLIGYLATKNNTTTARQAAVAAPQVITVNGGGGGGGSSAPPTAGSGGGGGAKAAKAAAAPVPKKVIARAQAAASKVLGASAKNLPPPTVTVGAKGSGPGYQGGHFTGNFFGGG